MAGPRNASIIVLAMGASLLAARSHTVTFGKWTTAALTSDKGAQELRIRPLFIDGHLRERVLGPSHDVTDRLFVVERVIRLNDTLPQEISRAPRWIWQPGGWISVDRTTGHVAQLSLPDFDAQTSRVSWYRDFAGYCAASEDGGKAYMVVFQLGRRKPLLKREFTGPGCAAPGWQRDPVRITFLLPSGAMSFSVRGHTAELQEPAEEGDPQ